MLGRVMLRARLGSPAVAGEQLDIGAAGAEQLELVLLTPADELPQVQLIRLPGQA